jgi:hypothetical protein
MITPRTVLRKYLLSRFKSINSLAGAGQNGKDDASKNEGMACFNDGFHLRKYPIALDPPCRPLMPLPLRAGYSFLLYICRKTDQVKGFVANITNNMFHACWNLENMKKMPLD